MEPTNQIINEIQYLINNMTFIIYTIYTNIHSNYKNDSFVYT